MNQFTTQIDEQVIRELLSSVVTAFNRADLEELLSFHSEDVILMEPNMPVIQGKKKVREMFAAFKEKKIEMKLAFNLDELEVNNDSAFARGQVFKTLIENGGNEENEIGKFITLLKRQEDGNWLRTHVIVNSDEPGQANALIAKG